MPGTFAFGELERLEQATQDSAQSIFNRTLVAVRVDEGGRVPVYVLAPATMGEIPGTAVRRRVMTACVFYHQGRCDIHSFKPQECRAAHHSMTRSEAEQEFHGAVETWRNDIAQAQVERLLSQSPTWTGVLTQ